MNLIIKVLTINSISQRKESKFYKENTVADYKNSILLYQIDKIRQDKIKKNKNFTGTIVCII